MGEAHLSWSVPDGNGLDIDAYIIEQLVADAWETIDRIPATAAAGTSVVYRGLTSGETVTYRVSAETSAGAGAPSEAVSGVIASPAPNAPELPETGPVGATLTSTTGATLALLGAALLGVRGARGRQRRVDPAHR
ncbi:fibronectin type III domain-containing protein [Demequina sp. NBRC 110052]|uniref:fibronectin type III domain-containing protein n=1 Tax=Demequina sp. NBRC 110052 TaxID=1570341 RepID=UPI001F48B31C|nr:fibronectin type III domain-containing protein [Demequina sp. NBRC 110052]